MRWDLFRRSLSRFAPGNQYFLACFSGIATVTAFFRSNVPLSVFRRFPPIHRCCAFHLHSLLPHPSSSLYAQPRAQPPTGLVFPGTTCFLTHWFPRLFPHFLPCQPYRLGIRLTTLYQDSDLGPSCSRTGCAHGVGGRSLPCSTGEGCDEALFRTQRTTARNFQDAKLF